MRMNPPSDQLGDALFLEFRQKKVFLLTKIYAFVIIK